MRQGLELVPIEIEVILAPGLPQIHILGLPDAALKESALRIRTAIRKQGFKLPKAQQILVHLRPNHLRKSSHGLDLAIAAALIWESGQAPRPEASPGGVFLYGALSLTGDIETPEDAGEIPFIAGARLYTGCGLENSPLATFRLRSLSDLTRPLNLAEPAFASLNLERPAAPASLYPHAAALIAQVIAAGEHSALFAGPPGSGKSTLVASIRSWLAEPASDELAAVHRWARGARAPLWRPLARPHHSATRKAMVGGGTSVWAGEVSRAHTGVLIMDELLRFEPEVQEALREPVESGSVALARAGQSRLMPARVLLLATTNLCDCGQFVPRVDSLCRCPWSLRRRHLARLRGPFADRFHLVAYSDNWDRTRDAVPASAIAERVARAISFRRERRGQVRPNALAPLAEVENQMSAVSRDLLDSTLRAASRRRIESVTRVARTMADLRQSDSIAPQDLKYALELGWQGHKMIEDWRE